MAYIVSDEDEKAKEEGQNLVPVGTPSNLLQPQQVQSQGDQTNPERPTSSGSFTNLQQYLEANKDAAPQLAQNVSQKISGKGEEAKQSIQSGSERFKNEVNAGIPQYDETLLNNLKPVYQPAVQPQGYQSDAALKSPSNALSFKTNPTTGLLGPDANYGDKDVRTTVDGKPITLGRPVPGATTGFQLPTIAGGSTKLTDENQKKILAMRDAAYQGPQLQTLQDYLNPARQLANDAKGLADQSKTEQGRYDLLRQTLGTPNYSKGSQRLDQALLQTNPEARAALQNVQDNYSGIGGQVDDAYTNLSGLVPEAEKSALDTRTKTKTSLQDALNAWSQGLTKGTTDANAARLAAIESEKSKLGDIYNASNSTDFLNSPTYKQITGKDYSPDAYLKAQKYGVNFDKFVSDPGEVKRENLLNADSKGELDALTQLMGENNPMTGAPKAYDPTVGFNREGYQGDVYGKLNKLRTAYNLPSAINAGTEYQSPLNYGAPTQTNLLEAPNSIYKDLRDFQAAAPGRWNAGSVANAFLPSVEQSLGSSYSTLIKENEARKNAGLPTIGGVPTSLNSVPDVPSTKSWESRLDDDLKLANSYKGLVGNTLYDSNQNFDPEKFRKLFG